jgi:uncharacterized protein YjeT (DUF2065 family)
MTDILITILGIYWILGGTRMLIDPDGAERLVNQFEEYDALAFLTGVIVMIAGIACLHFHNIWTGWREIIVTIVLWAMTIEGALMIVYPKILMSFARKLIPGKRTMRLFGLAVLIIGAALLLF